MIQWEDPDPGHSWPVEIRKLLDLNPANCTARLAFADFLEDNSYGEATLIECLKYMGLAGKYPARRMLSTNAYNLSTGYGWWAESAAQKHAIVPMEIRPLRVIRRMRRPTIDWVWGTRQKAEDWFVSCWAGAGEETRAKLLAGVMS